MGVALIGWGRFTQPHGTRFTVPAPNTNPGKPWLWDFLASQAGELAQVGFTAVQLPPASKAQGGAGPICDGYSVFDPRDLGSKEQQGSVETRYGSVDSLRRLVACFHAAGMQVYLDVVLHQLSGENGGPGVFQYLGADGKTLNGRGPMQPSCFRGVPPANRPEDAVPVPADDFEFGREKVYQNCLPPGYTIQDALDYGDWLFRTTDADGMRFDDTKGTWAPFVSQFMRSKSMANKFAYSEYFDGDPQNLNGWATRPPMSSRSLVEDFTLHFAMQNACDNGYAPALNGAGYAAMNPFLSVTFVDNPDTDTTPGEQVISSKLLAYAFMLSVEGYPMIYGKDYFGPDVWPGAYGLKPWIDTLVWIHENLAEGDTATRYVTNEVIVFNRLGGPGLLTALNFDTYNVYTITCETAFGPNVSLQDYAGHHADITTDGQGRATFTIPANAYGGGQSYLCFSRQGLEKPVKVTATPTSQVFFGAADLDIPPLSNGTVTPGRIWASKGTPIQLDLAAFDSPAGAQVTIRINGPDGAELGSQTGRGSEAVSLKVTAASDGWHTPQLTGAGLAAEGIPFELTAAYTAPLEVPL